MTNQKVKIKMNIEEMQKAITELKHHRIIHNKIMGFYENNKNMNWNEYAKIIKEITGKTFP